MELKLTTSGDKGAGSITVSEKAFGIAFNEPLVHQVVVACLAAERAGTKAQKTRAEVSGGGIKPWRQKGTGRARAGTIRSPLWRKGGVTFAAKPRKYTQKVNKKMYQGALRSIFSELVKQDRLVLVEDFKISSPKTKEVLKNLNELNIKNNALLVTEKMNDNLYLATRNLPHIEACAVNYITPANLIGYDKVLMTVPAVKRLEEWLA